MDADQVPGRIAGAARQSHQVRSFALAAFDQVPDAQQAQHGLLAPLQGSPAAAGHQGGKIVLLLDHRCTDGLDQPGRIARSEEHTSELQSLMRISYDVFCLKHKECSNISRESDSKLCDCMT